MSVEDDEEEAFKSGFERAEYGISRKELEAMGPRAVRFGLNMHTFAPPGHKTYTFVSSCLADMESAIAEADGKRRDAREADTLAIANDALATAKDANRIASEDLDAARSSAASAREQARWAKWAAIIATIAAIIAAKDHILALIFRVL